VENIQQHLEDIHFAELSNDSTYNELTEEEIVEMLKDNVTTPIDTGK